MSEPTRLITIPERMATMRCLTCKHRWQDMDAATSQYPVGCPKCIVGHTEPVYEVDGTEMPEGWTW